VLSDLHAHYPMHVVSDAPSGRTVDRMRTLRGRDDLRDKVRALVLSIATRLGNDDSWWSGFRVTVPLIRQGSARVIFSVLYRPFEEMDLDKRYGAPPAGQYFAGLLEDIERVEADVAAKDPAEIRIAHNAAELDQCLADGATALIHCVEGGFHLGDTEAEIDANVAELARRGVAYVTVAHLFFRQVATNANALPFLPDWLYDVVFPQAKGEGLTARGAAIVRALVRNGILVDLSHMRPDAVAETFSLLDEIDPAAQVPVISSHAGYRFGSQEYMHDTGQIQQIKRRDGVIGLIMAHHQLDDGIRKENTASLDETMEVIDRHVGEIASITGDHRHVAIGSDLDGFIKPTVGGVENMAAMSALEAKLRDRYGADADLIASENALRVLRKVWT
jgi:microsomal dipeptidase-like Zn-dependent dipeptidase